jgi:TonB family protein
MHEATAAQTNAVRRELRSAWIVRFTKTKVRMETALDVSACSARQCLRLRRPAAGAATWSTLASDPTLDVVDGSRIAQVTIRLGDTVIESRALDGRARPVPRLTRALRWGWALLVATPLGLVLGWPGLTAALCLVGLATGLLGTLRLRSHRRPSQLLVGSGPGVDVPLDDPTLYRHPLVTVGPAGPTLHVAPGMEGTVVIGRTVRWLRDLEARPSPLSPGASSFPVPEDAYVEVRLGPIGVEVTSVAPARRLPPAKTRLLWREQLFQAGSFVVHASIVLAALIIAPSRPAQQIEEAQRRAAQFTAQWVPSFRGDPVPFHPSFVRARDPFIGNTRDPDAPPGLYALRGPRDNADPHLARRLARDAADKPVLGLLRDASGSDIGDIFGRPQRRVGARVAVGRLAIRGAMDREIIRRVIRRHLNEVKYCYLTTLKVNPSLAGRVVVGFVIKSDGRVTRASVVFSTLRHRGVETCLTGAIRRWRFPWSGRSGIVEVQVPLVFR